MGPLFAIAVSMGLAGAVDQDDRSVTADIELSEWTPPMRLALDLETGRYVISPSSASWRNVAVRPDPRHGTLKGEALREIRTKFADAVTHGVSNQGCVKAGGKGYPWIVSNAGIPRMTLRIGNRQLQTSSNYGCWAKSATGLHRVLIQTFDRNTP